MSSPFAQEIWAGFCEEVRSYLPAILEGLERVDQDGGDAATWKTIHRCGHSIKGSAAMVEASGLSRAGRLIEDTVEAIEEKRASYRPQVGMTIRATVSWIDQVLNVGQEPTESQMNVIHQAFTEALGIDPLAPPVFLNGAPHLEPVNDAAPTGFEALGSLDGLGDMAIIESFQAEAEEHLQNVADSLRALSQNARDEEALATIRRSVHTLKGAAAMVGFAELGALAHGMENLLDRVAIGKGTEGRVALTGPILSLLHQSSDALRDIATGESADVEHLLSKLQQEHPTEPAVEVDASFDESPDLAALAELLTESAAAETAELDFAPELVAPVSSIEPVASVESIAIESFSTTAMFSDGDSSLAETFQLEAEEHLQSISSALLELDADPQQTEPLDVIRRAVHTLKGVASMVGFIEAGNLAHRMEDLLERLVGGQVEFNRRVLSVLHNTSDALRVMTSGEALDPSLDPQTLMAELQQLADTGEANAVSTSPEVESVREEELLVQPVAGVEIDATAWTSEQSTEAVEPELSAMERPSAEILASESIDQPLDASTELESVPNVSAEAIIPVEEVAESFVPDLPHLRSVETANTEANAAENVPMEVAVTESPISEALTAAPAPPLATKPQAKSPIAIAPKEEKGETKDRASVKYVRVPIDRLDQMVRLVSELLVTQSYLERQLAIQQQETAELELSVARVKRVSNRLDTEYAVSALQETRFVGNAGMPTSLPVSQPNGRPADDRAEFDSLEFDRYTEFHLLCRDLHEVAVDLQSGASKVNESARDLDNALTRVGRFISDLQDSLMRVRLLPINSIAPRLHRTLRVAADSCGKDIQFLVDGEDVQLDKTVLDELVGALEHLIRNSVDHGIELPEDRVAKGKTEKGSLKLSARQDGAQVVIELQDDGQGFQLERLRKGAVTKGLISEEASHKLSREEIQAFAFHAGFSTAQKVSQISGRGIGLDVLRDTVHNLRGTISLDSHEGLGTTFTIRVPLSLAIQRVMLLRDQGATYAIPQESVVKIVRSDSGDIEFDTEHFTVEDEGQKISVQWLHEVLGQSSRVNRENLALKRATVLLLDLRGRRLAVAVEQVIETRDVAIKPLGNLLQRVPLVSGAAILGDGSVVTILDLAQSGSGAETPMQEAAAEEKKYEVLIVDDSLTVRRLVAASLTKFGFGVVAARDGVEALEYLRGATAKPDCLLVDVEMPRMDGFELTRIIRSEPELQLLPVVMLTSRAGDKHRQKAAEVGANNYLIKPYQEDTLVETLRQAVGWKQLV
jgi:chemosensory pili system protein ChpA (sensor histidine kinase/response regulator)